MSSVVFLDSSPLGILANSKNPQITLDAIQWSVDLMNSGTKIIVPAIADFEVRRELTRTHSVNSLAELDKFNAAVTDRYLALTDSALKRAAAMWAVARNRGTLPADPKELNGDVLIAAQVLDYQQIYGLSTVDIVIATINTGHLSLFVPAAVWSNILP